MGRGLCPGDLYQGGYLSSGGGGSLSGGVSLSWGAGFSVQGKSLSRVVSVWGGVSVQGVSVWGVTLTETPHPTVTCGWYASYWNAFLFFF